MIDVRDRPPVAGHPVVEPVPTARHEPFGELEADLLLEPADALGR